MLREEAFKGGIQLMLMHLDCYTRSAVKYSCPSDDTVMLENSPGMDRK